MTNKLVMNSAEGMQKTFGCSVRQYFTTKKRLWVGQGFEFLH